MKRLLSAALAGTALLAAGRAEAQEAARIAAAERLLERLVEGYGVSGAEAPVRRLIESQLPAWARPSTDSAGNLWVRVGKGGAPVVVVAHMDEIGFRVSGIRDDGTLELATRGGFFPSLYEGRPALVHTARGAVPAIFPPRDSAGGTGRRPAAPLRVDPGTGSREATAALGIQVGHTVTSPKEYTRLAGTRATARSFDDRVGCAALLIALRRLDTMRLRHEVIFVWSVREEVGLEGARAVAASLGVKPARVHAIDTFVSADSPLEPTAYGAAPLGRGPVARALDNSSATPPALVDSLVALARAAAQPLQTGATSGGNDGSVFAPWGVPDVPVGWPLRYAHSPVEVVDLRDVVGLSEIVRLIAERW